MTTVMALLIALASILSGIGDHSTQCSTENFEDGSKIEMCYTDTVACSAWFDAETGTFQGMGCNVK